MKPRLQFGDIIEVQGNCFLYKLEAGKYRVRKVYAYLGQPAYSFSKPRGKKERISHLAKNVDLWVSSIENPDINKIVIIHRCTPVGN